VRLWGDLGDARHVESRLEVDAVRAQSQISNRRLIPALEPFLGFGRELAEEVEARESGDHSDPPGTRLPRPHGVMPAFGHSAFTPLTRQSANVTIRLPDRLADLLPAGITSIGGQNGRRDRIRYIFLSPSSHRRGLLYHGRTQYNTFGAAPPTGQFCPVHNWPLFRCPPRA
jgi:hypothetical protein